MVLEVRNTGHTGHHDNWCGCGGLLEACIQIRVVHLNLFSKSRLIKIVHMFMTDLRQTFFNVVNFFGIS